MHGPEVWSLLPSVVQNMSKKEVALDSPEIPNALSSHPFNHSVTILMSDTMHLPSALQSILEEDSSYYKVLSLPVWTLIDKQFIDIFVKTDSEGEEGPNIDEDDYEPIQPKELEPQPLKSQPPPEPAVIVPPPPPPTSNAHIRIVMKTPTPLRIMEAEDDSKLEFDRPIVTRDDDDNESLKNESPSVTHLPLEPVGKCSPEFQQKIASLTDKMKETGNDMNSIIQLRKSFRNPSIYEKLIQLPTPRTQIVVIEKAAPDIDSTVANITNASLSSSVQTLGRSGNSPPTVAPWWSSELDPLKKEAYRRRRAFQRSRGALRTQLRDQYYSARSLFHGAIRRAKRKYWKSFVSSSSEEDNCGIPFKYATNKLHLSSTVASLLTPEGFTHDAQSSLEPSICNSSVTSISIDTPVDVSNSFALTPTGILILSLTRDLFLSLGIDEGPAVKIFHQKTDLKCCVQIDLKEPCLHPSKKNYRRIIQRLKSIPELKSDFICAWEPNNDNVCPSSIAAYWQRLGFSVMECTLKCEKKVHYNMPVPNCKLTPPDETLLWAVMCCIGSYKPTDAIEGEFLGTYIQPDHCVEVGQVISYCCKGLITSTRLSRFYEILRNYFNGREPKPLVCLIVSGFEDSAIAWVPKSAPGSNSPRAKPHQYLTSGDNNLSVLLNADSPAVLIKTSVPLYS